MKTKIFAVAMALVAIVGCGREHEDRRTRPSDPPSDMDNLKRTILDLQGLQAQINALILSDYASCASAPADGGSTNDALIRKICQIAQASTVEAKVQMKGELSAYANTLNGEIGSIQGRLSTIETSTANVSQVLTDLYGTGTSCATATAGSICVRVSTLETSVSTLQTNMTNAQSAITTLQGQVATINATLATVVSGMMLEITVGNENLAAGPLYESVLRKQDRSRVNSYIESLSANVSLASNPLQPTNGSPNLVVTKTAHGLSVGNVVKLDGLQSGAGFTAGQVNDQYAITAVTANTFTVVMSSNATNNAAFGGANGYYYAINGRGLGQAWQTSDGEVYAATTFSYKTYQFIITGASSSFTAAPTGAALPNGWAGLTPGFGFICYDKTNRSATAAAIKLGGANIICK